MSFLITPILKEIKTFDATENMAFYFDVDGGRQSFGSELAIEEVSSGNLVYKEWLDSTAMRHIVPANTLTNGKHYKVRMRTKDINNISSEYSSHELFWCFSKPIITINGIDYENQNRVYNQTATFEGEYFQAEGEELESYYYNLYDVNKNLLYTFDERFISVEPNMSQTIASLENNAQYFIELKTLSFTGNLGTSGLIKIRPYYIAPRLNVVIKPENIKEEGSIKVSADVVQIILRLFDNKGKEILPHLVEYVDGEKLDMNRIDYSTLIAETPFEITQSDFSLRIWVENLTEFSDFLLLKGNTGEIRLMRTDNYLVAEKTIPEINLMDRYRSNFIMEDSDQLVVELLQINNRLNITVKTV